MPSCKTFVISSNKAQDVFVPEHDSLIDLSFTEPRALVPGREDLNCHVLAPPLAAPHLAVSTFSDGLLQDNGSSYGSLDQQWQPCKMQTGREEQWFCLSRS